MNRPCSVFRRVHRLPRFRASLVPAALTLGCLLVSCQSSGEDTSAPTAIAPVAPEAEVRLFDETLELEDGAALAYQRGVATVAVRRDDPSSGTMEVEFFRFPRSADASADTPPIFLLHGGPGFRGLGPRLERPGYFENRLARLTRISDLIVPGQRGFGSSTATPCESGETLSMEEALDSEIRLGAIGDAAADCRKKWESEGFDLTGLNVVEAAGDVVDIARQLGYDQIQLRGGSFGSHWAMTILRFHPELVARATLTGLEGPDHTYDMPGWVLGAMERIAASAEASTVFGDRIPEGGLLNAYRELIARAATKPIAVEIAHPETGDPTVIELDGDRLRRIFSRSTRYTGVRIRTAPWPLMLLDVLHGDYQEVTTSYVEDLREIDLNDAAFYQLDCGSGISRERGVTLRSDPAAEMLGPTWLWYDVSCAPWDADLGETFRGPFESSVPTVLVQGNWDTSTPYENAVELRPFFRNHRFVHVEGGSHGALREALEEVEGFQEAMDHWLATGEMEQIPESVELPPFPWTAELDES
ncbi:MAG: alpha/beta hydrolase [Thermoanaerobaculia bacterium]|nr:alpha/beta hydrolase [Thermoanaerobaculia bacterium]